MLIVVTMQTSQMFNIVLFDLLIWNIGVASCDLLHVEWDVKLYSLTHFS